MPPTHSLFVLHALPVQDLGHEPTLGISRRKVELLDQIRGQGSDERIIKDLGVAGCHLGFGSLKGQNSLTISGQAPGKTRISRQFPPVTQSVVSALVD